MQPTPAESFPAPALLIMRSSRQEITVSGSVALLLKSKSIVAFKTVGQNRGVTELNAVLHLVGLLEIKFWLRHTGCISFGFSRDTWGWHVWLVSVEAGTCCSFTPRIPNALSLFRCVLTLGSHIPLLCGIEILTVAHVPVLPVRKSRKELVSVFIVTLHCATEQAELYS